MHNDIRNYRAFEQFKPCLLGVESDFSWFIYLSRNFKVMQISYGNQSRPRSLLLM